MSVARQFTTRSAEETIAVGRELREFLKPGQMIVLRGNLGAGKTTLVKGIAEGFHAALQEEVTSPTFNLVHEYRGPALTLFHIDLYRIDTERELMTLAIDDLRSQPGSILLVEWGEKFQQIADQNDGEIAIERTGESDRQIVVRVA
ncbi:MAG TPA: tRNA (adenosine(37)-N6)-threonylcarbamoyltransferase complex ATPase subunit type 1 TsaE [Terriglobales bacterium]|nr:tRNA (adenosine(37)-N6)-threonylcarbamoyltransferase complex ATPase subunit type 1 TsaE [Terriglobales bacterium]